MNKSSGEVPFYVAEMADYLDERLPENPKIARRVIAELSRRRGRPIGGRIAAGLVIAVIAGSAAFGVEQWLESRWESRPRHEARLVELRNGELRLNVVYIESGKPIRILATRTVSKDHADDLTRVPGWEVGVIRELLAGSLSAVTGLRFRTAL